MRHWTRGALLGFAALGAGVLPAGGPATAAQPTAAWPQESPGDALSRNLKTLVANPHSVDALTGAGRAALAVGDAQAALGFLARAEDESPRDGRIKMWIASALVQLEQPHAALKFFKDAAELGVPEGELAKDRGLAYDIAGDQRHAQRDYRLSLQRDRDPEVVRRLALSLAIGGDREQALRVLDEQGSGGNAAAERTRALVLALTGDVADAGHVVQASMPGPQGEALMPFLARLPGLSPADRALAVHMGHFPQGARNGPAPSYAANSFRSSIVPAPSRVTTDAGRPDPSQPSLGRSTAALVRAAPPEASEEAEEAPPVRRIPVAQAAAPAPAHPAPPAKARTKTEARPASRGEPTMWSYAHPDSPPRAERPRPARTAAASPAVDAGPRPTVIALEQPLDIRRPAAAASEAVAPAVETPPPPATRQSRLADLAATVATLPAAAPPRAAPVKAAATVHTAKKPATAKPAAPKPEAKAASRHWVQIGIGEDEDALPGEFARLKAKAGKLLAARAAWTAPMGGTNRLLVGPFPDGDEAQAFVNELAEKKLRAFAWTSPAGEKVAKLPAK
jgi:Flp pilus assembly protein TadD